MNTRHLEEFLLFSEVLNYSTAAKKLFITRPTLSEHLNELERELGCKLVEKKKGNAMLTPAGKHFVQTATALLEEWENVRDEYHSLANNLLTVTVASTNLPWLETILYKARRTIHENHPSIQIDIVTDNGPLSTIDALQTRANDIVVTGHKSYISSNERPPLPDGICGFKLHTEEIKLLMTQDNSLFTQDVIRARDLNGATLMLPPDIYNCYIRDCVVSRFAEHGANITLKTADFNDHFEYFTYDFGTSFGIVPTTLIPRFGINEREECRAFSLEDMAFSTDFFALFREGFVQTANGRLLFNEMKRLVEPKND